MKRLKADASPKSISFKTALIIVVALHVFGALCLMSFSSLKKKKSKEMQEIRQKDSEFLAKTTDQEWPQQKQKPKVVAVSPIKQQVVISKTASSPIIIPLKPKRTIPPKLPSKPIIAQSTPKPTPKPTPKQSVSQKAYAKRNLTDKEKTILASSLSKTIQNAEVDGELKNKMKQLMAKANTYVDDRPSQVEAEAPSLAATLLDEIESPLPELYGKKTYRLSSGENLYMVSKKLNVPFNALVEVNNIRDVRDLYAGLELMVP
jgi:hypothetical protein